MLDCVRATRGVRQLGRQHFNAVWSMRQTMPRGERRLKRQGRLKSLTQERN